ncbi:hypothetical protein BBP40_004075 [Aspergillus hancockii]|nr:hypothetical protein BBP40_004075 [Aspergillus hancockii]
MKNFIEHYILTVVRSTIINSGSLRGPAELDRAQITTVNKANHKEDDTMQTADAGQQPLRPIAAGSTIPSRNLLGTRRPIAYLEQLVKDSQELHRHRLNAATDAAHAVESSSLPTSQHGPADENDPNIPNPLMKDRAWFQAHDGSALPIYVSEVACTAFATRLCQCLKGDGALISHIPRTRYIEEAALYLRSHVEVQWPSLIRARLLVNTALGHANPPFHLALRKSTVDHLQYIYQRETFHDPVLMCKYFALFALGEVYSTPSSLSNHGTVPGTAYYARAVSLIPLLPERPSMPHIEALVILSLYSQFLNRWQSAYQLIGNALRLGLSVGLNHNVPASQCPDPSARESRVRLWWTIHIFDRFWGLKLGLPAQVNDEDIHVDLPSNLTIDNYYEEFVDSSYQVAVIKLARIASQISRHIYSRAKQGETFLQREQKLLVELKLWTQSLPDHLRLHANQHSPKHTILIHLQFNYCVILAIRPILLYVLVHISKSNLGSNITISPALATLSEACIHSARHTMVLCAEEWTNGSLSVYGYAFAQYIFTSALVLVISSLLPFGSVNDLTSVETAIEMLRCFVGNGSLIACDLYEHLQRVQICLTSGRFSSGMSPVTEGANTQLSQAGSVPVPHRPFRPPDATNEHYTGAQICSAVDGDHSVGVPPCITTEMALYQPMMQDFLTQSVSDIGLLDPVEMPSGGTDTWPDLPLWTT